jgi:putative addiction module component (TIGR02574 family)
MGIRQELMTEILALPVAERLRLVEAIWDSVAANQEALPLTQFQKDELDRRLAELEADPQSGATLEEVFARIRRSMIDRFIIRPRAETDIQAAFDWYESEQPGLGEEFLTSLLDRLETIRRFPESCPIVYRNIRRAVSRFPYLVFYVVGPSQVSVLAVLYQSRNPADWLRG